MNNKILKLSKILFNLNLRKEASEVSELTAESAPSRVNFSGILKLSPSNPPTNVQEGLSGYFKEHGLEPLPADKLHITLLNQAVLKPFAKELKEKAFPEYDGPITYEKKYSITRDQKESVFVVIKEQKKLSDYISKTLKEMDIGAEPEPNRIYHITLANKTGNPHDSVGHSEAQPIILKDCTEI
jgi:2'-5' RNA ligase